MLTSLRYREPVILKSLRPFLGPVEPLRAPGDPLPGVETGRPGPFTQRRPVRGLSAVGLPPPRAPVTGVRVSNMRSAPKGGP